MFKWLTARRDEEIARLNLEVTDAQQERDMAQAGYAQEVMKTAALTEQIKEARAITEIARRSVNPLTMTYQHITNIALILDGKEPL